jgi:endonuclease G
MSKVSGKHRSEQCNLSFNSGCFLRVPLALFFMLTINSTTASELHITHCLFGCPTGASPNAQLVIRSIYALAYNYENKVADWVAYKVSVDSIGIATSLSREAVEDGFVDDTLDAADFGIPEEDNDLGLSAFVPMVSFAGTPYWSDVNYLTNIVARSSALNRGAWYGLEWAVRNLVNREGPIYVLTGPIFRSESEPRQLPTNMPHRVPDAFYKILISEQGSNSTFIFEQDLPIHIHHCQQLSSVEEVEELTDLDFFPALGQLPNESLEQELGCN